jgi:hypothetical protein
MEDKNTKAIYEFIFQCGRMGSLEGLFIAKKEYVQKLIGKEIYFGEVLGKHSEIVGPLEEGDLRIRSEDQEFISKFEDIMGGGTISGHNPIDYYEEME